jgi:hypothetical protein
MTNPERIFNFLRQKAPQPFCDDCVAKETAVSPRQQSNPIASALGLTSDFIRDRALCFSCSDLKLVTRYVRHV